MPEGEKSQEHIGEKFLDEKYKDLANSPEVESAAMRQELLLQEESPKNKKEKIQAYLNRLDEIFNPEEGDEDKKDVRVNFLKDKLHEKFIIMEKDIPESYFKNQQRIAREQGHGDVEITPEMRRQSAETIIKDQMQSLDSWVDYLGSKDATYPDWLKYWSFRSITQLSQYDKEKHEFKKRSKGTTAGFPDINREALAYVLDAVEKNRKGETQEITDENWEKLLKSENFAKLYAHAIEKLTPASEEEKENIQGEWIKYDQGSDAAPLYESLQGRGTGWCTAGESTAKAQLQVGDFYVFYSNDKSGLPKVPRVAIRMQQGEIAEVRGINADQNLEPVMVDIAKEKYSSLPGGDKYEKRASDMKKLTEIEKKFISTDHIDKRFSEIGTEPLLFEPKESNNAQEIIKLKKELETIAQENRKVELSQEELKFLYEIDGKIEGFGYQRDPRIDQIKGQRDEKKDYTVMFEVFKKLLNIENKTKNQKELNREELIFLYQDSEKAIYQELQSYMHSENISCFRMSLEERDKLLEQRNKKQDYTQLYTECAQLYSIENKINNEEELTKEELLFLHRDQINNFEKINHVKSDYWFYENWVSSLRAKRDIKEDCLIMSGCKPEQTASNDFFDKLVFGGREGLTTEEYNEQLEVLAAKDEILNDKTIVFLGDLSLYQFHLSEIPKNLKYVSGNLYLEPTTTSLGQLEFVGGKIFIYKDQEIDMGNIKNKSKFLEIGSKEYEAYNNAELYRSRSRDNDEKSPVFG